MENILILCILYSIDSLIWILYKDGIMQDNKKSKKEILEKLRMILDDPYIKDESIKNKNLIKLQRKLTQPLTENIFFTKKELNKNENINSLKASVIIHRKEVPLIFEEKQIKFEEVEYKDNNENPFKNEELYEIEIIDKDISEFVEIKDDKEKIDSISTGENIEVLQDVDSIDNLPEWETVETEFTDSEIKKDEKILSEEIPEWEPITSEQFKDKIPKFKKKKIQKDEDIEKSEIIKNEINIFCNFKSIDEKIAELLIENGYTSIDDLKDSTIKDLTKIKGIKRKTAKKIKKEIAIYLKDKNKPEFESIGEGLSDEDFEKNEININDLKTPEKKLNNDFFKYEEYTLYRKEIILQSDKKRIIHFFSREKPDDGIKVNLPEGYEVKINKKTGVPYISRKK
jgi:transcription termination factor NusA